jgi:hypothetical protein
MKETSMKLLSLALVGVLTGCATQPQYVWVKEDSTQADFNRDNGQCRAQGFSVPGVTLMQAVLVIRSCMEGKGWSEVPRP